MAFNWREVQYVIRLLNKQRLVSALAILSVALGIGANIAFFGLINLLFLRPLPLPHPEELVKISTISPTGSAGDDRVLLSTFQPLQERNHVFSGIFAWNDDALRNIQSEGTNYLGSVNEVSGDFFTTLNQTPLLGGWFNRTDVNLGSGQSAQVAVLSYHAWKEHYHADPHVVGKTIDVDNVPLTIIGVTRRNFAEIDVDGPATAIVPIGFSRAEMKQGWYNVTGRLRPGVSLAQARAELTALWPGILTSTAPPTMRPEGRARYFARKIALHSESKGDSFLRGEYSRPLMLLMGLAGMILLITCVNLASIMLARTESRRAEFQVRLALGAPRWTILRLVLMEAAFITCAGSALGLALALWSATLLIQLFWLGYGSPALHMIVDARVLLFMIGTAFATAILFGLVPALRATHINPASAAIHDRHAAVSGFRLGKVLITIQVAITFVLVTTALLLATNLHRLRSVNVGYDRHNVLAMQLFPLLQHDKIVNVAAYYQQLAYELKQIPGVSSVSYSGSAPAFGFEMAEPVSTRDKVLPALSDWVAPGFFRLLGISVLEGREFNWQDDQKEQHVAILSVNLASQLFHHEDPIGRKIDFGDQPSGKGLTIIGVVNTASLWKPQTQNPMAIYLPLMQFGSSFDPLMLIKTETNPLTVAHISEHTIQSLGHQYSVRTQSLEARFNKMLIVERLSSSLSLAFGSAALLLASLGIYGLTSFIVYMRHTEIGIRIALGATRGRVLYTVLCDSGSTLFIGIVSGVPAGWAVSRLLSNKLSGLYPHIAVDMAYAAIILLGVSFVAVYLPALRVMRVDPATTLRVE